MLRNSKIEKILTRWIKKPRVNKLLIKMLRSFLLVTQKSRFAAFVLKGQKWYWIVPSQSLRQLGDSRGALQNLLKGVEFHKDFHLFHLRISQILRENHEIPEAHRYMETADRLKPGGNTISKLVFESEFRLFDDGSKTLLKVLNLPLELLRSRANQIDRLSIYYPEHRDRLASIRERIKKGLSDGSYQDSKTLSLAVAEAIGHRQIKLAIELSQRDGIEVSPAIQARLDRIVDCFGEDIDMLDTAWENETSDATYFFMKGRKVQDSEAEVGSLKVVELFIPTAIFDYPLREKQTHETIRETFLNIIRILRARTDIAIVPRMQMNWRECLPKTTGAYMISYHTNSSYDRRHLHVQEAPLSGYCSFDYAGYAGFSHVASHHEEIARFTASVSDEDLAANQAEMYERYVTRNISKYEQTRESKPIHGPYVFVALQVVTDVVAKLAWMPGAELLKNVADFYRGTGTRVVVKRHPFCRSTDIQKCLEDLEAAGDIVRSSNSVHDILKDAKLVFTVNSGVGLEALIHGKAVIVSGSCDYTYATRQAKTPDDLRRILESSPQPDPRRIRELLYFYIHSFAIFNTDKERLSAKVSDWLES